MYFALNYLSRVRPFRNVDDTLGVIYTHGFAGLAGGLLVGVFADPNMALGYKTSKHGLIATGGVAGVIHGNWTLLKWQFFAALFVIVWTARRSRSSCSSSSGCSSRCGCPRRTWRSATPPSTATRCTRPTCRRSDYPAAAAGVRLSSGQPAPTTA